MNLEPYCDCGKIYCDFTSASKFVIVHIIEGWYYIT